MAGALVDRWHAYLRLQSPTAGRLATAVVDGTGDLPALPALALAEAAALPPACAQVDNTVRAAVLSRLRDIYAPVAQQNYTALADDFDGVARQFAAAAAQVIDPDADAKARVNASEKERRAWGEAEHLAHLLDSGLRTLSAVAGLAGARTERDEQLLPLVVDASGCHRRRLWDAWDTTTGRTGRWGALLTLGATVRAADLGYLDDLEPYRRPAPMQVRQIPAGMGVRQVPFDPEDDEHEHEAAVAAP